MAVEATSERAGAVDANADALLLVLERHARERPDRAAIARRRADGSFEITSHRELLGLVRAYARRFSALPQSQHMVPLVFGRTASSVAAVLGALLAGRAFSCVNPKLRMPQLERVLADTGATEAFVDAAGLTALKGGAQPDSIAARTRWTVVCDATYSRLAQSALAELAGTASAELWEPPIASADEVSGAPPPRSVAACLFTSGSTGTPKGVLVEFADLLARARAEVAFYGIDSSDVLLNLLPFSFDVGLNQLFSAVLTGAELVLLDSWLPADVLRAAAERHVTGISAVPSIWADFLRTARRFRRDAEHRSLRYVTISGGDLSPAQHERFPEVVDGARVFKTYGQTEGFRSTALRPEEYASRPLSVGRPFPGARVYVVRDDGSLATPGEVGEVVQTGVGVFCGYADGGDPEHKRRPNPFFGPSDPNPIALYTGDLGSLDAEGFLFLRGRRDDLVKCNGNRVYPNEVRDQLAAIPGVASAEVVVLRSAEETRLAGFVVPAASAELDVQRVRLELLRRVPSYMVPEVIVVQSDLPRTASGKPDRPSLARVAESRLASRAAR